MHPRKRVMVAFGTRPEAIKMAPVIAALKARDDVETIVAVTAQHRGMLDQVLDLFRIVPDFDLDVMSADQTLPELFSRLLLGMTEALRVARPDLLLVHGDTSTTLASALAGFYQRIEIAHVEAGLRTGNMRAPWPEEANRRLTAPLVAMHFAPTATARRNLLAEGIDPASVHVTGNTVIDALLSVVEQLRNDAGLALAMTSRFPFLDRRLRLVLVTGHRRENLGGGFERICDALTAIAARGDVQIVYPVHPNPNVAGPVHERLRDVDGIHLVEPQDYLPFVYLMDRAHLLLTDSGGVQEEAPSLGKPVLVMRETTERPEAVDAGTVRLVGTCTRTIVDSVAELLDASSKYEAMSRAHNPYGDGHAASRIAALAVGDLGETTTT